MAKIDIEIRMFERQISLPGEQEVAFMHISDIHCIQEFIKNSKGGEHCRSLEIAAEHASRIAQESLQIQLHTCILSGDIDYRHMGMPYEKARKATAKFLQSFCKTATGRPASPDTLFLIPGNHDIYRAPRHKRDPANFNALCNILRSETYKDTNEFTAFCSFYVYKCDGFKIVLCGFDSTLLTGTQPEHFEGVGYISEKQMGAFTDRLHQIDCEEPVIRIAVLHHHVMPMHDAGLNGKRIIETTFTVDSLAFRTWLRRNGFSLVLHGHRHKAYIASDTQFAYSDPKEKAGPVGQLVYAASPPPTSQPGELFNGFNIIAVSRDNFRVSAFRTDGDELYPSQMFYHDKLSSIRMAVKHELSSLLDSKKEKDINHSETELLLTHASNPVSLTLMCILELLGGIGETEGGMQDGAQGKVSSRTRRAKGSRAQEGFLKCLLDHLEYADKFTQGMGGQKGVFSNDSEQFAENFTDPYSLARINHHMAKMLFSYVDRKPQSYIHCAIISEFDSEPHVLLRKHKIWPMYLFPNIKTGCIISGAIRHAKGNPDLLRHLQNIVCCGEESPHIELKDRGKYITPSGAGFSHHYYTIKICQCTQEQADCVKKGIDMEDGGLRTRWFCRKELNAREHITLCPPTKELFGDPKQGFFPDNMDIIDAVFERYEQLRNR